MFERNARVRQVQRAPRSAADRDDVGAVARSLLLTLADRDGMARKQRQGLNEQARLNAERSRAALHEIMKRAEFSRTLD